MDNCRLTKRTYGEGIQCRTDNDRPNRTTRTALLRTHLSGRFARVARVVYTVTILFALCSYPHMYDLTRVLVSYTEDTMKLKAVAKFDSIPVSSMPNESFAVAVNGFKGEVFFRNIAGIHGLTSPRYWPSRYITDKDKTTAYIPEFDVVVLKAGATVSLED